MIFWSLRKTKKWYGGAAYVKQIGKIYLPKFKNIGGLEVHFVYIYFHEILHLLLYKLGIKQYRNENVIFELAQRFEMLDNFWKDLDLQ